MPIFSKVCNFSDVTIVVISYLDTIVINIIYTLYKSPIGVYVGKCAFVLIAAIKHGGVNKQIFFLMLPKNYNGSYKYTLVNFA